MSWKLVDAMFWQCLARSDDTNAASATNTALAPTSLL
jgi:hypothetical protein